MRNLSMSILLWMLTVSATAQVPKLVDVLYNSSDGNSIYRCDPDGSNIEIVVDLGSNDQIGGVIEVEGVLYAASYAGGIGYGTIFKVNKDGSDFTELYELPYRFRPQGELVHIDGKLYGVSNWGSTGTGSIFSIGIDGNNFTIIKDFAEDESEGDQPFEIIAHNGKIWGTTYYGGENSAGVIYSINTDGTDFTIAHHFTEQFGRNGHGKLSYYNGKFYGQTIFGGQGNGGTIFSIDEDGTNFTMLTDMWQKGPLILYGSVIVESGKLWGTSNMGGNGFGAIFSLDLDGSDFSVVHAIDHTTEGRRPLGSLLSYDGKFYGTTMEGGANGNGTLFSIDNDGANFTVLKNFDSPGGRPSTTQPKLVFYPDNQIISFTQSDVNYSMGSFNLLASSSNPDNPIAFESSDPSIVSVNGNLATINGTGEVTITARQTAQDWFYEGSATQVITINPGEITVGVNGAEMTYGSSIPSFGYDGSGFAPGENWTDIDQLPSLNTSATSQSDVGFYDITASDAQDENYIFTYVSGTLGIYKRELIVVASNQEVNYGEELDFAAEFNGFVNGDNSDDIDELPMASTESHELVPGEYIYSYSGGTDNNYSFNFGEANASIIVNKAPLIVSADNVTIVYGENIPTLTYSIEGLVGDDEQNELDELPTASTTASLGSSVGEYTISLSGGSDDHYNMQFEDGLLSISKAPLKIMVNNETIDQGEPIPDFNLSYEGFVLDDEVSEIQLPDISTAVASSDVPGSYDIVLSGGGAVNYEIELINGTLEINAVLRARQIPKINITISPNPAISSVNIHANIAEIYEMALYNLNGVKIMDLPIQKTQNLEGLKSGIYLINIKEHNNNTMLRLVKS